MGNKVSLEDEMINLRIVGKQMQRSAKKCEKNEKAALEKLKKVGISSDFLMPRLDFITLVFLHFVFFFFLILLHWLRPLNKETMRVHGFTDKTLFVKKIRL
mmetsp:Transcript_36562/g.88605  ORF Transcript_36562/g.88605 Transcript_36562/m.88605 type:complete len:101 (-) Transcript_36562:552-854(-)